MTAADAERKLGRSLPAFLIVSVASVAIAYVLGVFSAGPKPTALQRVSHILFTLYIVAVPLLFIAYLLYIDLLKLREEKGKLLGASKLLYDNPFDLPTQEMHGFKVAFITGLQPTLTGLTGDRYSADDQARCEFNVDHVPPVAGCDCGFYAYLDIRDAKHQLSINPTSFLIEVDLYGVGFAYSRGFRAEAQVVKSLSLPKICMRCKILPPELFVQSYKFGLNSHGFWSWEFRCSVCSSGFKEENRLTQSQMAQALGVALSKGLTKR